MKFYFVILCLAMSYLLMSQELSFEEAQKEAQDQNKKVILVFSGSDWCIPCMKLKKYILDDPEFQKEITDTYVVGHADFPQKKKNKALQSESLQLQNKELAEKYNPNGYFPLVVVFDQDMQVKGKLTYEEVSPEEFAQKIAEFQN